jgi:predicted HTH transcriptional regulator
MCYRLTADNLGIAGKFRYKTKDKGAELKQLIDTLRSHGRETEWLEFKVNYDRPQLIGEYLSALSNSACLYDQPYGYLVFGVDDSTHKVIGTDFRPHIAKGKGNEGLEPWLARQLAPRVDFRMHHRG